MRLMRYRGRHLKARPHHGRAALGTAAAVWAAAPSAYAGVHAVQAGETLYGIADRYDTSVTALARANDLADPNLIIAGAKLRIPGAGTVEALRHRVAPGETLSSIAARYGTSVRSLARMNRIADPNLIVAGKMLTVPARGDVPPAAPASSIEASLQNQAVAHGVDPSLVKSIAYLESGWRQDVVSDAGAVGVMQVLPSTARYVNRSLGGGNLNVHKADDNVHLGVMYLHHLMGSLGSESRALAGYYSGPGNVGSRLRGYQRWYVKRVKALKARF